MSDLRTKNRDEPTLISIHIEIMVAVEVTLTCAMCSTFPQIPVDILGKIVKSHGTKCGLPIIYTATLLAPLTFKHTAHLHAVYALVSKPYKHAFHHNHILIQSREESSKDCFPCEINTPLGSFKKLKICY